MLSNTIADAPNSSEEKKSHPVTSEQQQSDLCREHDITQILLLLQEAVMIQYSFEVTAWEMSCFFRSL